jgi:hypothetical protein
MDNPRNPLNESERNWLAQARALNEKEPPLPWRRIAVIQAAGVFAGGWTQEENFVLISHDGYSVTSSRTGERLLLHLDQEITYDALIDHDQGFVMPESGEQIKIFGLSGGDGIHVSEDGWHLEIIYPWWPQSLAILTQPRKIPSWPHTHWENVHALKLQWVNNSWLKCGFSTSDEHFVIFGTDGAEIFTRSVERLFD